MRTKVLFLWALLCTLCINNAFGQNQKEIVVSGDSVIIVGDLFPEGIKIYGDKVKDVQYGGNNSTYFKQHQCDPNQGIEGVEVLQDENKRVVLKVTFDKLEDNTVIKIVPAINNGTEEKSDYYPDDSNMINFTIKKKVIVNEDTTPTIDGEDDTNERDINQGEDVDKENASFPNRFIAFVALLLLLLLPLCYFMFKLNKKIKKLEVDFLNLQDEVKSLKNVLKKDIQYPRLEDRKRPDTMTKEEIQTFVVSQIQSLKEQLISTSNPPDPFQKPRPEPLVSPVLDTDKVKYHPDSNSFSIEEGGNQIFRIYSRGNDFFYTIVDDSATRQELVGIISTYAGCVTLQTTEGEASRIEPVSSGRLYKDGNRYLVDTNNKLIVRFAK